MRHRITLAAVLVPLLAAGCSIFDDPTPENVFLRMTGPAGLQVEIIYSRDFVAGVDERGVTEVQVFDRDTVRQALPLDTAVNISEDRRLFVQIAPIDVAQATVELKVDIDDRNMLRDTGAIFAEEPWRWVYHFNHKLTREVDVVF